MEDPNVSKESSSSLSSLSDSLDTPTSPGHSGASIESRGGHRELPAKRVTRSAAKRKYTAETDSGGTKDVNHGIHSIPNRPSKRLQASEIAITNERAIRNDGKASKLSALNQPTQLLEPTELPIVGDEALLQLVHQDQSRDQSMSDFSQPETTVSSFVPPSVSVPTNYSYPSQLEDVDILGSGRDLFDSRPQTAPEAQLQQEFEQSFQTSGDTFTSAHVSPQIQRQSHSVQQFPFSPDLNVLPNDQFKPGHLPDLGSGRFTASQSRLGREYQAPQPMLQKNEFSMPPEFAQQEFGTRMGFQSQVNSPGMSLGGQEAHTLQNFGMASLQQQWQGNQLSGFDFDLRKVPPGNLNMISNPQISNPQNMSGGWDVQQDHIPWEPTNTSFQDQNQSIFEAFSNGLQQTPLFHPLARGTRARQPPLSGTQFSGPYRKILPAAPNMYSSMQAQQPHNSQVASLPEGYETWQTSRSKFAGLAPSPTSDQLHFGTPSQVFLSNSVTHQQAPVTSIRPNRPYPIASTISSQVWNAMRGFTKQGTFMPGTAGAGWQVSGNNSLPSPLSPAPSGSQAVTNSSIPAPVDHVLDKMFGTGRAADHLHHQRLKLRNSQNLANDRDPQLRSSRASRLAARSHQDTDVLSGYPARQWTKETSSVNLAPQKSAPAPILKTGTIWIEHPLPRGAEMYSPHTQELLRRARAPAVPADDIITPDEGNEDAGGEEDKMVKIPRYSQVPLGQESPGPKYLAERRQGLLSLREGSNAPSKRKAKVRQTLSDGTEHVIEVLVPVGQTVPGEITDTVAPIVAEILPPGTVIEGVGVANREGIVVPPTEATTPQSNRKKPPPPKRKKAHPLKGKKKKVMLEVPNPDGSVELVESAASGGTPRPDENDDEDGDEDGETPTGTPTPEGFETPSALPDPPRSAPADPPAIVVNDGVAADVPNTATQMATLLSTQQGQDQDAMDVDVAPVPAAQSTEIIQTTAQPTISAVPETSDASQPSEIILSSLPMTSTSDDALGMTSTLDAGTIETVSTTSEPTAAEQAPPTHITESKSIAESEVLPTTAVQPEPTSSMASAAEPAFAPASEQTPVSIEAAAPDNRIEQGAGAKVETTHDQKPEIPTATPTAAEPALPAEQLDAIATNAKEPTTAPTEDAVPEALKPEEIATSNPTTEEAVSNMQGQADEQTKLGEIDGEKEIGQADILGSLEQSLG